MSASNVTALAERRQTEGSVNLEALTAPFAESDIRQRKGRGDKMLSYVAGETVIKRLNEATDNHWDLQVEAIWSDTMPGGQNVMLARVRLTLPGLGSREHIGVQVIGEKDGEDMYKGCITDAVKKAATLFGVGLELYEDKPKNVPAQQQNRPSPRQESPAVKQSDDESQPWTPPEDVKNTAHLVGVLNKHYGWQIAPDARLGSLIDDLHEEYQRSPQDAIPFDTDKDGKQTRYPSTVWRWVKERATPITE